MNKLLYYPNFEIQDINFLKFALLYIDTIRPIIPENARKSLSGSMKTILDCTNLMAPINQYSMGYDSSRLASVAAIKYLEDKKCFDQYGIRLSTCNPKSKECVLYSDKFTYEFENYCLENGLGQRCDEGITLSEDVGYAYMSILAEIISKEKGIDMITDNKKYTVPTLRESYLASKEKVKRLGIIQREIQFYVPVDFHKLPIEKFIELRSDPKFEELRKNFVKELNIALDAYDENLDGVDLKNLMECKKEMYGLLMSTFRSCAAVAAGVCSFGNMCSIDKNALDFWGNAAGVGLNLSDLKQSVSEMSEYVRRLAGRKEARKYLARLKQLRPETL